MEKLRQKISSCRFENYIFGYATLYFFMVAPPRAFKIKARQVKTQGELANLPIYVIMTIELAVRFAIVLVMAACVEGLIGNTLYEINRIDVFFVVLMAVGTFHSLAFYLICSRVQWRRTLRALFYRLIRNTCYAILSGFTTVVPVLIWKWDHQLPPFDDGLAIQLYSGTVAFFLLLGVIEAKVMDRMPLGTHSINSTSSVNKTPKNLHAETSPL